MQSIARGLFQDYLDEGDGSGIVISPDGYVVTNNHVIEGASLITVHLPDGGSYKAKLVGTDVVSDLAVLKIGDVRDLPVAKFASTERLRVGDWVIAMGNALALPGGPTVTLGIVSALGRTIETPEGLTFYDLIQTDAELNDGSSGGPLLNIDGEVVGINQAILRQGRGMGFAIGAPGARQVIDSLIEHGHVVRPAIGFTGYTVTSAVAHELNLGVSKGVLVTRMARDGPAYKAGIRRGDVVTKIDGIPTPNVGEWLNLLWSYKVGDRVKVEFVRANELTSASLELVERRS